MSTDNNSLIHQAFLDMNNGRLGAAGALLRQVVAQEPERADALQMLGLIHALDGNPRQAVPLLRRASRLEAGNADVRANLARACWESGLVQEAADAWEEVIALGKATADTWSDRAIVLRALGRHEEALASLERALALDSRHLAACINCGNILHELGRYAEALDWHEKAIALQPDSSAAWDNKAATLERLEQYEQALACHDRALVLEPRHAMTWSNRGVTLHHLKRLDEAMASFDRAIALDVSCVNAWINRGSLLNDMRQHEQAMQAYSHALALRPDSGDALSGQALAKLAVGEFELGWQHYEGRWKRRDAERRRHADIPPWLGEQELAGQRILLWSEQGLGDTLQFCRYATLVKQRAAAVVLEVPFTLQRLLAHSFPDCEVRAIGEALPPCDFQIPLLSLPLAFRTGPDTIPAQVPYLRLGAPARSQQQQQLQQQLQQTAQPQGTPEQHQPGHGIPAAVRIIAAARRPRIGIACSGRRSYAGNRVRSMPLASFAPLQKVADLVLLQKDVSADDLLFLRGNASIQHPLDSMEDFAATAEIASAMDLIVSVDTALAHLAGAMALPVWLLLPWANDWRWQKQREDSPWYPGMRLFRQDSAGDWDSVIVRVLGALACLPARR